MAVTIFDYLQTVPDFREASGKRYALADMLLMMIFGMLSGYYGYRELGTFVKANRPELVALLGLQRDAVPSYGTFRTVMGGVDFLALRECFSQWAHEHLKIAPGEVLSLDGKALASTVSNYDNDKQDFISFLSVFAQRQGAVLSLSSYHHGKSNEIVELRDLIEALGLTGVTFSVDALHCQKKH